MAKEKSFIVSGFGGQGTLFAGQLMAYAALDVGKEVTWIPSYGPEMRGGTARCTVIISDEMIGSPLVRNPDIVIAMNTPSVLKYEPLVASGGLLLVNQSLVDYKVQRKDIKTIYIPANEIAQELGNARISNMIMIGAMLKTDPMISIKELKDALKAHIPERHQKTLPINYEAIDRGAAFVHA